jgi:hypothetical protein
VSYRPWLEERALRQMGNLPAGALDVLVRICEDPYDRLFSMAVWADDRRSGWLSDLGKEGTTDDFRRGTACWQPEAR